MSELAEIPAKPEPLVVNFEAIPGALKDRAQWIGWKWVWNGKKWDKPPFRADGNGKASSTDPATWSTYGQAEAAYRAGGFDGIGFVLTKDDPFTMVDLDKCQSEAWAVDMFEALDSYTEGTPSGNGYHVIIEATKPEGMGSTSKTFHDGRVEVYSAGRYMTVTGHYIAGTPASIEPRQAELEAACAPLIRKPSKPPVSDGHYDMTADQGGRSKSPMERVREVLQHLPNSGEGCPYEDGNGPSYIGVMMAVHDETSGAGFEAFREWSAQSSKHNPAEDRRKWDSLTPGRGVGFGSVVKWAQDYGSLPKKRTTEKQAATPDDLKQEARQNFLDSFKEPEKGPLPAFPEDLLALPYGLGELQAFVFGTMAYPSPAGAGITALAIMTAFAQRDITIESQDGLGLNEQYMLIGGTGTGKDAPRRAFRAIHKAVEKGGHGIAPAIIASLPASPQGLHKVLEEERSQFILSDEHGKRWASLEHNHHAKQLEEYLKELFSSSMYSVNPGVSKTDKYQDVWSPRVSILATSTPGHVASAMEAANGESGVYNRWLILPLEDGEERPQKRYTGLKFSAPAEVVELLEWVQELGETSIKFEGEAFKAYMDLDQRITEPLKIKDNVLAGRLAEHGIKMAGLIALSDRRTSISPGDLKTAFAIVEGIYHRMKASLGEHEAMDDAPDHVKAMDAIKRFLTNHETFTKGGAFNCCRPAKRLNPQQKDAIFRELTSEGFCELIPSTRGQYKSNVHGLNIE